MHALEEVGHLRGAAKYHTRVHLGAASILALQWWVNHLQQHPGSTTSQRANQGFAVKWGDGSGTGTGGTTELYPVEGDAIITNPNIELWMGVWGVKCKATSSNWKELRTVLQALRQEVGRSRVKDTTVFYFTDNLVSYYVVNNGSSRSPGLHTLVQEIKEVEALLQCHLEIVHVPGGLMIEQQTDGLSRGIWMAPERRNLCVNQQLFVAVPYHANLGQWALKTAGYPADQPFAHVSLQDNWSGPALWGSVTLWTPPPECARQALVSYLRIWVQNPYDSAAIFLVPRILQKQWGHVCKHIRELGIFLPSMLPIECQYTSLIPFVFLHISPFIPTLKTRMEQPAFGQSKDWHHYQAEEVRGLS